MPPKRKRATAAPALATTTTTTTVQVDDEDEEEKDDAKKMKTIENEKQIQSTTAYDNNNNNNTANKTIISCPYLSFVDRQMLDFDFERRCSSSLIKENCYCCLICGQFFTGRGQKTPAYVHALEHPNHSVFMHLENGRAFCLPDNYEIHDKSLDDIRQVLFPKFTEKDLEDLDARAIWSKALDGTEYLVGCVGLNQSENARGVNSVVQALSRVTDLRNMFLVSSSSNNNNNNNNNNNTQNNDTLQNLTQRIWNRHNFRGHTSPDSMIRKIKKELKMSTQKDDKEIDSMFNDPFQTLRHFVTFVVPKKIVDELFRGELLISSNNNNKQTTTTKQPFVFVPLKLPDAPLFRDVMEKNAIPQVALSELLKPYALQKAPKYLILAFVNRFSKNQFTKEVSKNPTIVTFPVKNLKVASASTHDHQQKSTISYDLLANVDSAGKATVRHVDGNWYETHDLFVNEVLAQQVTLGESYFQIYRMNRSNSS